MNNYVNYYNYMNDNIDNFLEPYKGFLRGNLFKNLYVPYMNYKPYEINPSNEKDYDMLIVQSYSFAAHDLNLYLDVNPNDTNAINLRDKYFNMYQEAKAQYESKYGPIDMSSDLLNNNPWLWDSEKWPWEEINNVEI